MFPAHGHLSNPAHTNIFNSWLAICHDAVQHVLVSLGPDTVFSTASLSCRCRIMQLPTQLMSACSSLCTLCAHQNPITVEHLRAAEGYAEYEAR